MIWFSNLHEFLTMKGYGSYVWPAWGVTLGLFMLQIVHARVERRRLLATLWRQQRRARAADTGSSSAAASHTSAAASHSSAAVSNEERA